MGKIIVAALIAGAVTGLASAIFAPDGAMFNAVQGVITKITTALTNVSV